MIGQDQTPREIHKDSYIPIFPEAFITPTKYGLTLLESGFTDDRYQNIDHIIYLLRMGYSNLLMFHRSACNIRSFADISQMVDNINEAVDSGGSLPENVHTNLNISYFFIYLFSLILT